MASGGSLPFMSGAVVGTGSLITVVCGFRPKRVELVSEDDPGLAIHTDTMGDGEAYLDDGAPSFVTSAAITLTDSGFTIGTNAALNTSGETVHWTAQG